MKKKITRIIAMLTIACALIAIVSALSSNLLLLYLSYKFKVDMENMKNASSIGIIGGSDGPTAIFISGQSHSDLITIIFGVLAILGVTYLIINKRLARKH